MIGLEINSPWICTIHQTTERHGKCQREKRRRWLGKDLTLLLYFPEKTKYFWSCGGNLCFRRLNLSLWTISTCEMIRANDTNSFSKERYLNSLRTWISTLHKAKHKDRAILETFPTRRRTLCVPLGILCRTTATAKLVPSTILTLSLGFLFTYSRPHPFNSSACNYSTQRHRIWDVI